MFQDVIREGWHDMQERLKYRSSNVSGAPVAPALEPGHFERFQCMFEATPRGKILPKSYPEASRFLF